MATDDTPHMRALLLLTCRHHRVSYCEETETVQVVQIKTQEPIVLEDDVRQCLVEAHRACQRKFF